MISVTKAKNEVFVKELKLIKNEDIKEDLIKILNLLPDYFYEVGASSTGKYHPLFAQGSMGLIRHTKAAVKIASELFNLEMFDSLTQREKDLVIYSLMVHDGLKYGNVKKEFSLFEHPLLMGNFILENSKLDEKEIISNMIKSHMGQWNTNKNSNVILPKPITKLEKIVHISDYLASRKYLNINFIGNEIEE